MGPLALALALGLSPPSAGRWALWATGQPVDVRERPGAPTYGTRLDMISCRESRWDPMVGVHVRDAMVSRRSWRRMERAGNLDEECQPYVDGMWATRGVHGLNAALHFRFLPECYQPEILDIVLVSSLVAARKFRAQCADAEPVGWCRRFRVSTCYDKISERSSAEDPR